VSAKMVRATTSVAPNQTERLAIITKNRVIKSRFRCPYCKRLYDQPISLRKHLAKSHIDLPHSELVYGYAVCDQSSTIPKSVIDHVLTFHKEGFLCC